MLRTLAALKADNRGSAIINVLIIVVVSAVIAVGVSTSLFSANGITTMSRAGVQSKVAAEAGIDWALGEFNAGRFPCAAPAAQRTANPAFTIAISYTTSTGTALTCSSNVVGTPGKATIQSTGYAQLGGTRSTAANTHVMGATATITPASTVTMDKVVYSASSVVVTNNTRFASSSAGANDAAVYATTTVNCLTQAGVEGPITSQGSITIENNCSAGGTLWSGGDVSLGDGSKMGGDIYAAGTGTTDLRTSQTQGSVITNGSVTTTNQGSAACNGGGSWKVCGSIIALGGSATVAQGSTVGGNIYAKGNISLPTQNLANVVGGNVVSVGGGFSGDGRVAGSARVRSAITSQAANSVGNKAGSCQQTTADGIGGPCPALTFPALSTTVPTTLGYPGSNPAAPVIAAPPAEQMPRIDSDASSLAKWTSNGWTLNRQNGCAAATSFIAGSAWSGKTLVVVDNCTEKLSWNGGTVTLRGDLAIMNRGGFSSQNNAKFASSTARQLMFIVPSDTVTWASAGAVTLPPSCDSTAPMSFDNLVLDSTLTTLMYTPCTLSVSNNLSVFKGQIYAGKMSLPNNSTITMGKLTVPGATLGGSGSPSTATAQITSRFDVG